MEMLEEKGWNRMVLKIVQVFVLGTSLVVIGACGNDDDEGTDTGTDTDTDTDTDIDTDSGTGDPDTEPPPDIGECVPALTDIEAVLDSLDGLVVDEFIFNAYGEVMKRSPQTAVIFDLLEFYEISGEKLDDLSYEYEEQTYDLVDGMLVLVGKYDKDALADKQRVELESFEWYLQDISKRRDFIDRAIPFEWEIEFGASPGTMLSYTLQGLVEVVDFESAEKYIDLLYQVDDQIACFRENLFRAADAEVLPDMDTLYGSGSISNMLLIPNNHVNTTYYQDFKTMLDALDNITEAEKEDLLESAAEAVDTSVIAAHIYLKEDVDELLDQSIEDPFLWQYPDGDAYYSYLLSHYVGGDWTAEDAHKHGLAEVARIRAEMDALFESLGYPMDETLTELFDRVAIDGGTIPQKNVMDTFQAIVDEAESRLDEAFDIFPEIPLEIVNAGYFAYGPSEDGIVPGEYYVNANMDAPYYVMPSVSYHEAFPGHHMQFSIAFEYDMPFFRPYWLYGFFEGWALYSEHLAKDLGWYDDDIYGDLGRLQDGMLRALRVVADTALHHEGWSIEDTVEYFQENIGYSDDDVFATTAQSEVNRCLRSPGTVPGYNIGMNKFLDLRQGAMDALGEDFDIKSFHRTILVTGDIPYNALDFLIANYIENGGKAPTVDRSAAADAHMPINKARTWLIID